MMLFASHAFLFSKARRQCALMEQEEDNSYYMHILRDYLWWCTH